LKQRVDLRLLDLSLPQNAFALLIEVIENHVFNTCLLMLLTACQLILLNKIGTVLLVVFIFTSFLAIAFGIPDALRAELECS
jgi:hypothetical protein